MITEDEIVNRVTDVYNTLSDRNPTLSESELLNRTHQLVHLGLLVNISNALEQLNYNLQPKDAGGLKKYINKNKG